jgi:hypothetical protein
MSNGKYWTKEEDGLLRANYSQSSNANLLTLFPGRELTGIKIRASRLQLKKDIRIWEMGTPFEGEVLSKLSEAEKGYLAGIIDGEGCIRLSRSKTKRGTPTYHIQVIISNTSLTLMNWLVAKVGGRSYKGSKGEDHWRERYCWAMPGNKRAITFLKEITPYLVIKKPQAESICSGYVHLSLDERDDLYRSLSEMKKVA